MRYALAVLVALSLSACIDPRECTGANLYNRTADCGAGTMGGKGAAIATLPAVYPPQAPPRFLSAPAVRTLKSK